MPRLDLASEDPRPSPCRPLDLLAPNECFPKMACPLSDLEWPLVDPLSSDCALVCMTNICTTNVCSDVPRELRIVHDFERSTFGPGNLEITDDIDAQGAPIRRVEGSDRGRRIHVEHALLTDAYAVWASDEASGETLWGPLTMQWSSD